MVSHYLMDGVYPILNMFPSTVAVWWIEVGIIPSSFRLSFVIIIITYLNSMRSKVILNRDLKETPFVEFPFLFVEFKKSIKCFLKKNIRGKALKIVNTIVYYWRCFFRWVQTSVPVSAYGLQKCFGHTGLILKLRDVKICSSFFRKLLEKMRKIDLENSVFNWYQLEKCKKRTFLIGNLTILEIQDRFKNYYFQQFTKKMMTRFSHP